MSKCCCSKMRWFIPVLLVAAVAGLGWAIGRQSGGKTPDSQAPAPVVQTPKIYRNIAGRIVRLDPQINSITLDHEEIPGFMRAMTMDMKVASSIKLAGFNPEDRVLFDLARLEGVYQIVSIRLAPAGSSDSGPAAEVLPAEPPLGPGDLVPDLELVNAQGEPFRLRGMKPRHKIITFFYARCPLENFCPAQTRQLAALQQELEKSGSDVHLLSLTLDGEHDGPGILAGYAQTFGIDSARWTLAGSAQPVEIRRFADRAGAQIKTRPGNFRIDHALIGLRVDGDRIVERVYGLPAIEKLLRQL